MNIFNLFLLLYMGQTLGSVPYKGLYLSPYKIRDENLLNQLMVWADSGLINTLVVDVKTDFGFLVYNSNIPLAKKIRANRGLINLKEFVKRIKSHGLRLIARIVVFKDPYLAQYKDYGIRDIKRGGIWKDAAGNAWVDPYNEKVWEYNIEIAKEVLEAGFDEVQFDYVRFPTDGEVWNCLYPKYKKGKSKQDAICGFLKKAREGIKKKIGVDVYGYAMWRVLLLEGQDIKRMGRYVDYICPMLYPSHFAPSFKRELNEFWRVYWIYYDSIKNGQALLNKTDTEIIPYIQGFDYKSPGFGPDYIYNQIRASLDAKAKGFFIWNIKGDYKPAFYALRWLKN